MFSNALPRNLIWSGIRVFVGFGAREKGAREREATDRREKKSGRRNEELQEPKMRYRDR
jgi:hypothetical protein